MLSYCLKCRKNTKSKSPKVVRTKNRTIMLLSKCEMCEIKKSKFIKDKEAGELLSIYLFIYLFIYYLFIYLLTLFNVDYKTLAAYALINSSLRIKATLNKIPLVGLLLF